VSRSFVIAQSPGPVLRIEKDSCGAQPPHNPELKALPGKAWPCVIHCTCIWDLGQVPNRRAVPITGLLETSLPRRSRIWQVVKVPTPDRCQGKSKISRMRGLITRFFGHPAGRTEDARRCTTLHRIDMQGAGAHAPALGTTKFQSAALTQPSNRAYSSSIRLSSSFLKSGAGWRSACPGGRSLFVQVPMAPV
jgi:hypothetical protein